MYCHCKYSDFILVVGPKLSQRINDILKRVSLLTCPWLQVKLFDSLPMSQRQEGLLLFYRQIELLHLPEPQLKVAGLQMQKWLKIRGDMS